MAGPAVPAALARTALTKQVAQHGQRKRRGWVRVLLIGVTLVLSLPLLTVACVASLASNSGSGSIDPAAAGLAGIPRRAAVAYQANAGRCPGLTWTLLAAIGAVESNHGQIGSASIDETTGDVEPWIFGPTLDGSSGTAAIPIGEWAGWWGLTGPWTQAVGPMQFLPATFETHAQDGNGDGQASPHNIDDAVATTAHYLCTASGEHIEGVDEIAAIYNPGSPTYSHELAAEERAILDALPAPTVLATGTGDATFCPVSGPVDFTDTWGAPRSGGRTHQGVDIFADIGTPVVAPADGMVDHYDNQLGGLSYRLYADDGTYYYGTHLSAYENVGAGWVAAGTIIGRVGNTGNAATTPPHLHWEIHPNGRGSDAINPTPAANELCG